MFLVDVNKSPQSAYAMFGTKKLLELMDTRAKVFTKSEMEAAFQHLEGSHWA